MKIAIVGSRNLKVDLSAYIPVYCTAIISGGAVGIDKCAAQYARDNGLELIEILPDYDTYGKLAPLKRNDEIIDLCDYLYAFWDGKSRGTRYVINRCNKLGKQFKIIYIK